MTPDNPFIPVLITEFHSTPLGGHLGIAKTSHRVSTNFYWSTLRQDVKKFVRNCVTCQQSKHSTSRPAGLLHPIPIPSGVWEDLSLDFITHLPCSHGFTVILVVVDRFSKGVHFGALPTNFTAYRVAVLFLDMVCKHHGLPRSLISDRDPVFVSSFWRELFRLSGTRLRMSTAYHPQTDGQTEVMNRVLEQYLRSFVSAHPSQWFKFLAMAEWSYNTSVHSSTGFTPYEIVFGKAPPSIPHYITGSSTNEAVDSLLSSRQVLHDTLRRRLLKAQATMKHQADAHRRDVHFEVGQWVYVRLRPICQRSITGTAHPKLSKRFFGPFQIFEKIGPIAYRLQLPPTAKIHPVFHCSLLRPHQGPLPMTTADPIPLTMVNNQPVLSP